MDRSKFTRVPSLQELNALELNTTDAQPLWDSAIVNLPTIPDDNSLLRERSKPEVYVTFGGAKFWVPNVDKFEPLGWNRVRTVPDGALASIGMLGIDGTLVREKSKPEVYIIKDGAKLLIVSPERFEQLGLSWADIRIVPDGSLASLPDGGQA